MALTPQSDIMGEHDDEFGSESLASFFLFFTSLLIKPGDEFDEVDLSVSRGEHPDETILEPPVKSDHLGRRPSPPENARSASIGTTPITDFEQPRLPAQKPPLASVPAPGPHTPFNARPINRARPSNLPQAQQAPHRPLPQQKGQSAPRQPQNPPLPLPPNLRQNLGTKTCSEAQSLSRQGDKVLQSYHSDGASSSDSSNTADHDRPICFFTARAAESVQNVTGVPVKAPAFDPHLESPSIRKTAGVDHTKTKPVGRESIGAPPMPAPALRSNFVHPQADKLRRVGMPVGAASPLQNLGSYKPPQMKRPAEGSLAE